RLLLFFFSSRRRHTRFSRDWSSDVCSSDLKMALPPDNPSNHCRSRWFNPATGLPTTNSISEPVTREPITGYSQKLMNPEKTPFFHEITGHETSEHPAQKAAFDHRRRNSRGKSRSQGGLVGQGIRHVGGQDRDHEHSEQVAAQFSEQPQPGIFRLIHLLQAEDLR